MKQLFTALLLLAAACGPAGATPLIGLFADEDATYCFGDTGAYTMMSVYIIAVLADIEAITAAEFSVPDYPDHHGYVIEFVTWTSPQVTGELPGCVSIAWSAPRPGPIVLIGEAVFFWIQDADFYPGLDYVMCVYPCPDNTHPIVVDDLYNEHDAAGGRFTFNCTDPNGCYCTPGTALAENSWGSVKSLY